jgi:hypothetical protein
MRLSGAIAAKLSGAQLKRVIGFTILVRCART